MRGLRLAMATFERLRGADVSALKGKGKYMELGMIGLGRMGTNMVRRLLRAGHQCVVYDLQSEAVQALAKDGAVGTTSLADFANKLKIAPRRLADGAGSRG